MYVDQLKTLLIGSDSDSTVLTLNRTVNTGLLLVITVFSTKSLWDSDSTVSTSIRTVNIDIFLFGQLEIYKKIFLIEIFFLLEKRTAIA